MVPKVLRFSDLKARGIVNNRATLYRWIRGQGFPPGFLLGPNSRAWREEDVLAWLGDRPSNEFHPNVCEEKNDG